MKCRCPPHWEDDSDTSDRAFTHDQAARGVRGLQTLDRESAYDFVRRALVAFDYHRLGKADRGWVRRYVVKVTALSPAQLTRLVARHAETGAVVDLRARNSGRPFERRYAPPDIRLLAEVDEAFGQMSGLTTCEILRRAFEVHGDPRFERLVGISRSHVYNLRGSRTYPRQAHDMDEDAGGERRHRGAPGPGAERPAGLSAGRLRAPGRPGRREGRLPGLPGGRGDAVRVRRRRAGHLGAVPDPGPGGAAARLIDAAPANREERGREPAGPVRNAPRSVARLAPYPAACDSRHSAHGPSNQTAHPVLTQFDPSTTMARVAPEYAPCLPGNRRALRRSASPPTSRSLPISKRRLQTPCRTPCSRPAGVPSTPLAILS